MKPGAASGRAVELKAATGRLHPVLEPTKDFPPRSAPPAPPSITLPSASRRSKMLPRSQRCDRGG